MNIHVELGRQAFGDRAAFLNDLLVPDSGGVSGIDITSLAMQVRDTRRGWKTLFPFFRP